MEMSLFLAERRQQYFKILQKNGIWESEVLRNMKLLPNLLSVSLVFAGLMAIFTNRTCFAQEPPFELPPPDKMARLKTAIIYTEYGNIHIELYPEDAPWHVANLKYRADKGYYKNTVFTYLQPGLLIQGGRPTDARKKNPYFLPPEFTGYKHEPGAVGMARAPDSVNPERKSHARQFYIMLGYGPHMNGRYTIFGRVTEGMDVVRMLRPGDRIVDIKVFVRK
ncbi:MAG: peptidylprolyl isomerase [Candidatus Dadabacteria bacterium]|nr:MAG: peptidylprolyl isomerase [Candidatus Dadabacteria bacterium]